MSAHGHSIAAQKEAKRLMREEPDIIARWRELDTGGWVVELQVLPCAREHAGGGDKAIDARRAGAMIALNEMANTFDVMAGEDASPAPKSMEAFEKAMRYAAIQCRAAMSNVSERVPACTISAALKRGAS